MSEYNKLFDAYRKCHEGDFSKQKIQSNVNELWKALKNDKNAFPANVENKIKELLQKKTAKDAARTNFFTRQVGLLIIIFIENE